jgi:hypothetical protein
MRHDPEETTLKITFFVTVPCIDLNRWSIWHCPERNTEVSDPLRGKGRTINIAFSLNNYNLTISLV